MVKKLTRGEQWAADVRENYPLNESEELLVDMISSQRDRIDSGTLSAAELRQTENVMLRAIGTLALPLLDGDSGVKRPSTMHLRAVAGARARHHKEQAGRI